MTSSKVVVLHQVLVDTIAKLKSKGIGPQKHPVLVLDVRQYDCSAHTELFSTLRLGGTGTVYYQSRLFATFTAMGSRVLNAAVSISDAILCICRDTGKD